VNAAEALALAVPRLAAAGVEGAARDARVLLAHTLDVAPDRLTVHLPDEMTAPQAWAYEKAVAAREARQPVAQITGRRLFWGQWFRVTRDTLDPRPETETLVAAALEQPFLKILDLGTGTGCILLSCLKGMPMARGLSPPRGSVHRWPAPRPAPRPTGSAASRSCQGACPADHQFPAPWRGASEERHRAGRLRPSGRPARGWREGSGIVQGYAYPENCGMAAAGQVADEKFRRRLQVGREGSPRPSRCRRRRCRS
jgi:hypothetical protein